MTKLARVLLSLLVLAAHAQAAPKELALSVETFDGLRLSAVLTLPDSEPRAVTVILPGSGQTVGLDGDVSGAFLGFGYKGAPAKLSEQIAEKLARAGVASLRYAKRGVEDATQLPNQTMPYLVKDADAAFSLVKSRFPGVKASFTGFSEGAMLAVKIASERTDVDALYLLGLPTRSIDDVVAYQMIQWPVELLRNRVDANKDGMLSSEELAAIAQPPIMGALLGSTWASLDANGDGTVSIASELSPAYVKFHGVVVGLLKGPGFKEWYESLQVFPSFSSQAEKIKTPVYLYHALDDAQVDWAWTAADARYFAGTVETRLFSGVGHCFSPMDGAYGEVKTSGPFGQDFLSALVEDFSK